MINEQASLISRISFLTLQQYLLSRQWAKYLSKTGDKAFFRKNLNNKVIEILLPLTREFSDYEYVIQNAIYTVAACEQRDPIQLINDLLLPPADQIRFRVNNSRTKDGLISLTEGFMLLESAKKALLAVAHDILKPATYHKRLALKDALQFVDSCLMGQTERGSFIASVVCPLGNNSAADNFAQLSLFDSVEELNLSFTRQVTNKLMRSLNKVKYVVENQAYDELESPQIANVSANFLEALVEMGEYGDNEEIQIICSWSPLAPQLSSDVPASVSITKDYILPLERIAERIREKNANTIGEYVGRISEIKADPELSNRNEGQIIFNCISDMGAIKARVVLNKEDLSKAICAFEAGKNIKVTRLLRNSGRIKLIEDAEFEIIA